MRIPINRLIQARGKSRSRWNNLWENKESLEKYIARLETFWSYENNRWKTDEEIEAKKNIPEKL